jgi:hypothetical protein
MTLRAGVAAHTSACASRVLWTAIASASFSRRDHPSVRRNDRQARRLQSEDDGERRHRLRQLSENVRGLLE